MKYVALLSGGKDSCFNLLHCQKNQHQLIAAATLSPSSGKEEIDSYLYQTVGQDGIALIATAMDVPLHRRVIQGHPLEQGLEYGAKSAGGGGVVGDETEDLYALLKTVLEHHPDVQAVAVGAILSNYQRVRVEHVCRRLSLTPLAYLWQRNQIALLIEMRDVGLNAVLIKVAGAGLKPSHLGLSLSTMYPTLVRLHHMYGTHACGEGGEYESFTLDCPGIFKGRVVLRETEAVGSPEGDVAPVAYLRIKGAEVVPKSDEELSADVKQADPMVPLLLEEFFRRVCLRVAQSLLDSRDSASSSLTDLVPMTRAFSSLPPSVRVVDSWIAVGNVQIARGNEITSIGEEVSRGFDVLQDLLCAHTPSCSSDVLARSAMITLLLPTLDSSTFSSANAAYATFFGASPPARACVGIGGERVTLDCVAWVPEKARDNAGVPRDEDATRRSLHVQSLSYWAPANIGPYSQAISIPPWTFVSGQIGLLPASLTLPECSRIPAPYPSGAPVPEGVRTCLEASSLPLETALVLQHTARVICASPGIQQTSDAGGFGGSDDVQPAAEAEVCMPAQSRHVQLVLYYLAHAQDVPHVQRGIAAAYEPRTPTLHAVVDALPRGARLEKVVVAHSGRWSTPPLLDSSDGEDHRGGDPVFALDQGDIACAGWGGAAGAQLHWQVSRFASSSEACAVVFVRGHPPSSSSSSSLSTSSGTAQDAAQALKAAPALSPFGTRTLSAKVFASPGFEAPAEFMPLLVAWFGAEMPALTVIPARQVASGDGRGWDWGVALMAV